jgi:hypothetical protein
MPNRHDESTRRPWEEPQGRDRRPGDETSEEGRNFESRVSDVNTDPDAMFDEDLNPTDEPRQSER